MAQRLANQETGPANGEAFEREEEFNAESFGTGSIKTAEVFIRGVRPLLMSSPKEMYPTIRKGAKPKVRGKTRVSHGSKEEEVDVEAEAEKRSYRDPKGRLCVEADAILANMYNAAKAVEQLDSKGKKIRGYSTVQNVKASVTMDDDFIPLLDKTGKKLVKGYEVHMKRVRNKFTGGAQIRYRPLIRDWSLRFRISWNEDMYGLSAGALRKIVAAGGRIGLLDWRPRHGIYRLESFKVIGEN